MRPRARGTDGEVTATRTHTVGQQRDHHTGVRVDPEAGSGEPQVTETARSHARSRAGPLRALAVETREQRPAGALRHDRCDLARAATQESAAPVDRIEHGPAEGEHRTTRPEAAPVPRPPPTRHLPAVLVVHPAHAPPPP